MAEEIQLGADVSDAVAGLGKVANTFQAIAAAAGASDKAVNAAMRNIERGIGGVVADLNKAQSAFAAFGRGGATPGGGAGLQLRKGVTQGFQAARREADAYQRSLQSLISVEERQAAQAKAMASANIRANSANRFIDSSSGRFVGQGRVDQYVGQLALAERLVNAEQQYASAKQLTAKQQMLENNLASKFHGVQDDIARQRERGVRQQQLEAAFASRFYGVADKNAGVLRRTANLLQQVPPASWGTKMAAAAGAVTHMSNSTRYAMYDVSASTAVAGAAFVGLGAMAINAAMTHERAFANVRRTTQTTEQGYLMLQRQLENMAMTLPVTYEEITQIAASAGQLGISSSGVASFTQTVAQLSATTNLTSEAAGIALARFKAFFAEVGSDKGLNVTEHSFSNLASSILKVGVNSIATETGIVNVATQIASMGAYSGMTANQVIGLAGALSSIGVAPELARGTITRTFSLIGTAVSGGGEKLEKFAALAGMTSAEFKASWGTENFAGTFQAMMEGLYNVTQSGQDANMMLMDLGFNSVRDRPLLLRLAGAANEAGEASKLLAQTNADAAQGWRENSELALQYSKISQTTSARVQVLGQTFEQLFATLAASPNSALGELASFLTDFVRGLEGLARSDIGQFFGSIAVGAGLLAGGLLLVISMGARTVASLQGISVAWQAMQRSGVTSLKGLSAAFKIANLSMGLLGIVGTIASVVLSFSAMNDAARDARRGVQDVGGLVSAMRADYENGGKAIYTMADATKKANAEQAGAKAITDNMSKALYGASDGAEAAASSLDKTASSASKAGFAFDDASKAYYRSQLLQSQAFQDLFNPDTALSDNPLLFGMGKKISDLSDLGFDATKLDWDSFMEKSVEGTLTAGTIQKAIAKQMGASKLTADGAISPEWILAGGYADKVMQSLGDLKPEILAAIGLQNAFGVSAEDTAAALGGLADGTTDVATGMSQMDEQTQKAIEAMAGGLQKFADTSALIQLTQQRNSMSAKEFEGAWTEAYGGASFKLSEYLTTFQRAADEQAKFSSNLTILASRGLDWTIMQDLAAMGPEANRLVQALVDGTDAELERFQGLWGQTGRDSMVAMAAGLAETQYIVDNIMADGGIDALRAFNKELASGKGVDAALAAIQRNMDGKKLTPKSNPPQLKNLSAAQKVAWAAANVLQSTIFYRARVIGAPAVRSNPTSGGHSIEPGHASGGWTGPGGKHKKAGIVHADEFVFTKKAVNNIGVGTLYAMMRQAENGTKAPRGYASGGPVGGRAAAAALPSVVHLSPQDRALLRSLQPLVKIGNRDIAQAQATANAINKRQGVG